MSVAGQPTLRFSYDTGARPTRIAQDAGAANNTIQSVALSYDAADRRTRSSYANGIVRRDNYAAAGQLLGIVYSKADGTALVDWTYAYDKVMCRLERSVQFEGRGSFSRKFLL